MEATHTIQYEGLELSISGEFEKSEPEVGYKGGGHTIRIYHVDTWMLKEDVERINDIVVEENY
jgi:hypothetical protein